MSYLQKLLNRGASPEPGASVGFGGWSGLRPWLGAPAASGWSGGAQGLEVEELIEAPSPAQPVEVQGPEVVASGNTERPSIEAGALPPTAARPAPAPQTPEVVAPEDTERPNIEAGVVPPTAARPAPAPRAPVEPTRPRLPAAGDHAGGPAPRRESWGPFVAESTGFSRVSEPGEAPPGLVVDVTAPRGGAAETRPFEPPAGTRPAATYTPDSPTSAEVAPARTSSGTRAPSGPPPLPRGAGLRPGGVSRRWTDSAFGPEAGLWSGPEETATGSGAVDGSGDVAEPSVSGSDPAPRGEAAGSGLGRARVAAVRAGREHDARGVRQRGPAFGAANWIGTYEATSAFAPEPASAPVRVSIGRVEVRAVVEPRPEPPARSGRPKAPLRGLSDYLDGRAREAR